MKQKEVTINDKKFAVVFSMKTMIGYENITGKSFFGENFKALSDKIALVMAAILAANSEAQITIEEMMNAETVEKMNQVIDAGEVVMKLAGEFFKIPEIEPKPKEPTDEEGKSTKN